MDFKKFEDNFKYEKTKENFDNKKILIEKN